MSYLELYNQLLFKPIKKFKAKLKFPLVKSRNKEIRVILVNVNENLTKSRICLFDIFPVCYQCLGWKLHEGNKTNKKDNEKILICNFILNMIK